MIDIQPDSETVNRPFSNKTKTIFIFWLLLFCIIRLIFILRLHNGAWLSLFRRHDYSLAQFFVSMFLFRRALILTLTSLGSDRAKYDLCKLSIMLVADAVHHCNLGCMCIKRERWEFFLAIALRAWPRILFIILVVWSVCEIVYSLG